MQWMCDVVGKPMKKYQVIGGQYESYWYGESDSLHGAKIIASKNSEYWDNWQGWHKPDIYLAEDCEEKEAHGWITFQDGDVIRVPKRDAMPAYVYGQYWQNMIGEKYY